MMLMWPVMQMSLTPLIRNLVVFDLAPNNVTNSGNGSGYEYFAEFSHKKDSTHLNLFIMRPRGVVSKNAMGARKTRWSISLWRWMAAMTEP